jgi:hypothetical protein
MKKYSQTTQRQVKSPLKNRGLLLLCFLGTETDKRKPEPDDQRPTIYVQDLVETVPLTN